jgi:hypothetical protein
MLNSMWLAALDQRGDQAEGIQVERSLQAANTVQRERFVRQAPVPPALPGPVWINKPAEVLPTQ